MAIYVSSSNPQLLVDKIYEAISQGDIDTWLIDKLHNNCLTHKTSDNQWFRKAWIGYQIEPEQVVFYMIGRAGVSINVTEYAIYHGRFTEMLLAHFDHDFDYIHTSALLNPDYDQYNK